jgi:spore coat protein A, manganese oxidase
LIRKPLVVFVVPVVGICLKPKATTQHDGTKGTGYAAYIPINYESAIGELVEVGSEYVGETTQYKDVISALPGQITSIRALFDKRGRFIWHCHFVSHEDHEMMRTFQVF